MKILETILKHQEISAWIIGLAICFFISFRKTGDKKFFKAIDEDDLPTVLKILNKKPDLVRNAKGILGESVLFHCTSAIMARELVARGADVSARNDLGDTPLMSIRTPLPDSPVTEDPNYENLDRQLAAQQERLNLLEELVALGVDINAQNNDGETALMTAAKYKELDIVEKLVELHALIDIVDNAGKTALDHATAPSPLEEFFEEDIKIASDNEERNAIISLRDEIRQEGLKIAEYLKNLK